VLNASRHHRKNRAIQARLDMEAAWGAQRLAASPEKSLKVARDERLLPESAQRLAASPEKSQGWLSTFARVSHRCSTPRGITGKIA